MGSFPVLGDEGSNKVNARGPPHTFSGKGKGGARAFSLFEPTKINGKHCQIQFFQTNIAGINSIRIDIAPTKVLDGVNLFVGAFRLTLLTSAHALTQA